MTSTLPEILHEKLAALQKRMQASLYQHVSPLEMTAWRTTEPRPFAQRMSGEKINPVVGSAWGEKLFDCAWFRFRARIPASVGAPLALRIDLNGELCLVDLEGTPVRGLTPVKSVFDRSLGTPAKTIFWLPKHWSQPGDLELWGDAGYNDLFGSLPENGQIRQAELCAGREDLRALYYDLEVLGELLLHLEDGECMERLALALEEAHEVLASLEPESVARARALLKPIFIRPHARTRLRVTAVGHAHLDLAWLWPIRETIRKGARTFSNALYNLDRYPEYVFGASQPQLYQWMKSHYPRLYEQIKAAVHRGRIEPQGVFWVEPDCNLPNGESLVRQVLFGRKFFEEEFGIVPRYCWQPDVFGYNGQLPQILKKSCVDHFMTIKISWNIVNRFPHHSFVWEGIDGSRINVHMPPEGTYNSPAAPRSLRKIQEEYAEREVSDHALLSFGIGDGGAGPDAEHFERLRREAQLADLPAVQPGSAAKFFEEWSRDTERFPVWKGELYLERHQGTFTTQALTKRLNRQCETALRELEWVSSLASWRGAAEYPAAELERIWPIVLLYQFHDILPGSSIKRVFDECNAEQASVLQELEGLIADRYAKLAAHTGGAGGGVVFNSLPWPRREWRQIAGDWRFLDVPGCSAAPLPEPAVDVPRVAADPRCLENEWLRVTLNGDGTIASIWHKDLQREFVAGGQAANAFVVYEDRGDAWDFVIDHDKKDLEVYLRQLPARPELIRSVARADGPCGVIEQTFRHRSSEIRQSLRLGADSELLEFETAVDWQESHSMLRVRFPVSVVAECARFEIPFGSITRSTGNATPVEKAQVEVPALQWVDLSDADGGMALLNDCKHGFRVKGNVLDMNLIRSVCYPAAALINQEDVSSGAGDSFTDIGTHRFRYALMPHAKLADGAITRAARCFNTPLRLVPRTERVQTCAAENFFSLDHPAIDVVALKRAEDGNGFALRLCNTADASLEATLATNLSPSGCFSTNLVETERSPLTLDPVEGVRLAFGPFEVRTILFLP